MLTHADPRIPVAPIRDWPTGTSDAVRRVREQLARVARFDSTVLVTGESGTGKEGVARTLHARSPRAKGPFVAVNCGAIPAELLESELFGHEKGAFTGAVAARAGRFELARGGTLFLDEIGEMSPLMQVKLLRVLQEGVYERVGSGEVRLADVRIVAATHRDLEADVAAGRFRGDLFFRLNVFPIELPPLRERLSDLPALIAEIDERLAERGFVPVALDAAARTAFAAYSWPGNVRELANVLERLAITFDGVTGRTVAGLDALPAAIRAVGRAIVGPDARDDGPSHADPVCAPGAPGGSAGAPDDARALPPRGIDLRGHLASIERQLIEQALVRSDGVVADAARLLGLGRTTLLEKLKRLGMGAARAA